MPGRVLMTPTDLPEWHVLAQRRRALEQIHIADLFDDDPQRTERFSFEAASLSVDLSRNRIDSGTLRALVALARASNLEKQRDDLLAGAVVNATEARPAWHTALRAHPTDPFIDPTSGARLQGEQERFLHFAEQLRAGHVAGATGLAIAHGRQAFGELLAGAAALDAHFAKAPLESNLPVLLGMLGVWYVNFWGIKTRAVVPYSQALQRLPAYLQQLEMESLGKRVDRAGAPLSIDSAPVVWGEVGSNAQHSVCQFLHQGTGWVPLDIVMIADHETGNDPRL